MPGALLDAHAHLSARLNRELQASSGLSLSDYDVLVHLTDVPEGRLRAFELGEGLQGERAAPAHVELVRRLLFDGLTAAKVRTLATVALSVIRRLDEQA